MQRRHFHLHLIFAISALASVGTIGCTPESRNYGSGSGGAGGGAGASTSSGRRGGAGGAAMCPPDTADCDMNGVCETNLLGDVDHCGTCDNACVGIGASCIAGKCDISCGMGFDDCDQNPATACQDLGSDGANCGACGHDCLGGGCIQGACQPTVVLGPGAFPPAGQPLSIAVYGGSLYVGLGSGQVVTATLDGATPKDIAFVSGPAVGLAVTSNGIYVASEQRAMLFDFSGSQKFGSSQDGGVRHVAANDLAMVWTATLGNRVRSAAPTGGNQSTVSLSENQPGSIILDGNFARWLNATGEIREGMIQGGGAGTTIFAGPPNAHHLILDAGQHFWVADAQIFRGILGNGISPIHPADDFVGGLVADGTYLYWTSSQNGEVWRGTEDGSLPKALVATGQANPTEMAVAPLAIYWINQGDGTIMRLAR